MSFILDALRKSEHERERRALPGLVEAPVARSARPVLAWILGGFGVLLVINAAVLAWLLLRTPAPVAAAVVVPVAAPVAALPAPRSMAPIEDGGRVRPLAAEAADPSPEALEPPPVTHAPTLDDAAAAAKYSVPVRAAPTPGLPPTLRQLPAAVAAVMPPLNVDLHVYSPVATQRFVIINGQRVHEGGVLKEGLLVEQITPEGVVLNHQGTRFTLSRE
jgi:general secretion pathway protein B